MIKNVQAQQARVGQKLRNSNGTSDRITEVLTIDMGYRTQITTLYGGAVYSSYATIQVEE
jgi:hypothetical protein